MYMGGVCNIMSRFLFSPLWLIAELTLYGRTLTTFWIFINSFICSFCFHQVNQYIVAEGEDKVQEPKLRTQIRAHLTPNIAIFFKHQKRWNTNVFWLSLKKHQSATKTWYLGNYFANMFSYVYILDGFQIAYLLYLYIN